MKVTVRMTGFQGLAGTMGLMDVRARVGLEHAVDRSSAHILAGASARVPRRTGELAKTLRRTITRDGMAAFIMAGYGQMARKGAARAARARGQKVNQGKGVYAPAVEFGSQGKPAHPFLFPALNAEAPAFVAACGAALHEAVSSAVPT